MPLANPFTAISLADHEKAKALWAAAMQQLERERQDARTEVASLRGELKSEVKNAERLTSLCARAVASVEKLEAALRERQIGKDRDPALVLIANLPGAPKRRQGFMPLKKRRREAARKDAAEQLRRTALPKLEAELPTVPLTQEDRAAMKEAVAELEKP